jgi:anti-sigma factor RsiW
MDCALIEGHLIAYELATLPDGERAAVEAHLIECRACLRTYLGLKAHVDHAARAGGGPSDAAYRRLRAAVGARFRPTPLRRIRRWLSQPVPLYRGLAIVAVVAVAVAVGPSIARALRPAGVRPAEQVDSVRPFAQSRTIY